MKKPLKIISIDGTRGAGKSSQIGVLSRHFKTLGLKVSSVKVGGSIDDDMAHMAYIEAFLSKTSDGIVIMDGSIARPMVKDLISGIPTPTILEKYRELTHAYERLDHKYGIACFLIVMSDLRECGLRLEKYNKMMGLNTPIPDLSAERDVVLGMKNFNNHIVSKNLNFQILDIVPENTMMEIQKAILEKLDEKYEFEKPKRDPNDW